MSHASLDFLLDSVLLSSAAHESLFSDLTDAELRAELSAYRQHVLDRLEDLRCEVPTRGGGLGAFFGASLYDAPKVRQVMRAGLYFDLIVIDDPLFPHGREPMPGGEAFARFLGYTQNPLDRQAVADAGRLVQTLQPLLAAGFVKLVPASIEHDAPREMNLLYSPGLFSESVPAPLLSWFHNRAEVVPLRRREDSVWEPRWEEELEPCRGILVRFRGLEDVMNFHLTAMTLGEPVPGREGVRPMTQWIPEEPPDMEAFQIWTTQCVNQFAGSLYQRVASDMRSAASSGTMMFTDSQFISELLDLQVSKQGGLRQDLANLAMRFELPFLEGLSVADLRTIRESEGEAFKSYRVELERQLRSLRNVGSEEELCRRLKDVQHELVEVQVKDVQREVARLRRGFLRGAAMGAASLAAVIPSSGVSLATLALAAGEVTKTALEHVEVRREPAYFVWRLLQKTQQ